MNHTSKDLAEALRVFISSGSANGNEPMRKTCLKLISTFAAAPELLEMLKKMTEILSDLPAGRNYNVEIQKARIAISKAQKGE